MRTYTNRIYELMYPIEGDAIALDIIRALRHVCGEYNLTEDESMELADRFRDEIATYLNSTIPGH